ncbi:MAG: LytTR family DNA-binding domain-containing protein [Faecalibacterium sp.]
MPFQLAVFCPVIKRRSAVLAMCNAFFPMRNLHGHAISFPSCQAILEEKITYDAYLLPLTSPPAGQRTPDGLLLAQALRKQGINRPIIFVAPSPEWAYEAFRVNALQYLLTPLSPESLYPALEQATAVMHTPIFALTTAQGVCGIPFSEIESVECTNHVLHFHCRTRAPARSLTLRVPLRTALAPLLQDARFVQPHRSFVVNLSAVDALCAGELLMKSGAIIPVPRDRYASIKAAYLAFLAGTQQEKVAKR